MTFTEYEQLATNVANLNQGIAGMTQALVWWKSLSLVERCQDSNKNELVATTEHAAEAEFSAWIRVPPKLENSDAGEETNGEKNLGDRGP